MSDGLLDDRYLSEADIRLKSLTAWMGRKQTSGGKALTSVRNPEWRSSRIGEHQLV